MSDLNFDLKDAREAADWMQSGNSIYMVGASKVKLWLKLFIYLGFHITSSTLA